MGTSLLGLKPKNTYQGLLKTSDNTAINATTKFLSDGLGNDSALSLSTTLVGIGTSSPIGKLQVNNATNGASIARFKDALAATTYIDFKTDATLTDRMGLYWGSDYRFLSKQGASLFINCEFNAVFANGLQAVTTITPSEVQVGTITGGRLAVKGSGATAATNAVLVQNSASTTLLSLTDSGNFATTTSNFSSVVTNDGSSFQVTGSNASIRVGTSVTIAASSILQADSTTKGFLPPRMTDAQARAIVSPVNGLIVYNTTINHLCCYQAGAWVKFSHTPM
jgi:hypothetical protein